MTQPDFSKDPEDYKAGRMESCRTCRKVAHDSAEIIREAAALAEISATGSMKLVGVKAITDALPSIERRIAEIRADIDAFQKAKERAENDAA